MSPTIDANVRFGDWFYYEPGQIWIEHGNQYEAANCFRYWLAPLLPETPSRPPDRKDEIDLPLGSFFVRYLFNRIEHVEPFADNVKPSASFVIWMFRRHPGTALEFIFGDGRYMLGKLRRAWKRVPAAAWADREEQHVAARNGLAQTWGISPDELERLDGLAARSTLQEPVGIPARVMRWLTRWRLALPIAGLLLSILVLASWRLAVRLLTPALPERVQLMIERIRLPLLATVGGWALLLVTVGLLILTLAWLLRGHRTPGSGYLVERAQRIASILGVRYVVMGHTHDAELFSIGKQNGNNREYFNTGTWTTVFSDEERLIRKPVEFIHLQGLRRPEGLRMKLMEWDDGAGEPRLLSLFRRE